MATSEAHFLNRITAKFQFQTGQFVCSYFHLLQSVQNLNKTGFLEDWTKIGVHLKDQLNWTQNTTSPIQNIPTYCFTLKLIGHYPTMNTRYVFLNNKLS